MLLFLLAKSGLNCQVPYLKLLTQPVNSESRSLTISLAQNFPLSFFHSLSGAMGEIVFQHSTITPSATRNRS